ncbi:CerR family C-terminal domain-containing protein [Oceanidesulfovibrio marinus]|uniref:TetR/AcrR family transcriptional regulator n=1 Tax=Oceanidesulfovibrio marinus TaxID=370038 RepID=A0A6P1ZC73_9BACT|nr:CerR family C-terminal domain-containing protein [Oceanidesulfovibrio marinus]TVM31381.1 TetR/AcrR family transcriptional regulator [Oceanidesulfovibrio marinus]
MTSTDRQNPDPGAQAPADTKARLLESAGRIFAAKGFRRATGKEICQDAGANMAAINYHFGSKDSLYTTVLIEAHSRLMARDELAATMSLNVPPQERLAVFLDRLIRRLFTQSAGSWPIRVVVREMADPTPAFRTLVDKEILPKSHILRRTVAELMDLPVEHEAALRTTISIIAQVISLFQNRAAFEQIFPELDWSEAAMEPVRDHILTFSLAGAEAVAAKHRA